jgi:hypothetical protein
MKRKKIELKPCLKAQDFQDGQIVKVTTFIKEVVDVETKFGDNTIIYLEDGDSVFMNATSLNNIINAYGEEDSLWIGKPIRVICKKDPVFSKNMFIIEPIIK